MATNHRRNRTPYRVEAGHYRPLSQVMTPRAWLLVGFAIPVLLSLAFS